MQAGLNVISALHTGHATLMRLLEQATPLPLDQICSMAIMQPHSGLLQYMGHYHQHHHFIYPAASLAFNVNELNY